LTSSNIMPVLRRANISYFINIDDLKRIGSSSIFTDHRHIDVHFAFHLINCSEFLEMTQYIPHGNCFHPREIVGATFVVNDWSYRPDRIANDNHFVSHYPIIFFYIFYILFQVKTQRKRKSLCFS
jgi:hypothetical protein